MESRAVVDPVHRHHTLVLLLSWFYEAVCGLPTTATDEISYAQTVRRKSAHILTDKTERDLWEQQCNVILILRRTCLWYEYSNTSRQGSYIDLEISLPLSAMVPRVSSDQVQSRSIDNRSSRSLFVYIFFQASSGRETDQNKGLLKILENPKILGPDGGWIW